jgi:Rieske 2Fe-2S family protein
MTTFLEPNQTLVAGSRTLPGNYYTSPEIFQAELEHIFFERWLVVGRAEQVPQAGDYFLVSIGLESIIVVRDRQGQVNAFYNVCRHRGVRICTQETGRFPASIQCPYHAWTYGLDGKLIGAPLMDEVLEFDKSDYPLQAVNLVEWQGFLLINLSRKPLPFEEAYAPVLEKFSDWSLPELRIVKRIDYEVKANWKLVIQNYSECYHCPLIHPELARKSPYRSGRNDLFEGPFLGGYMDLNDGIDSLTLSGRVCSLPISGVQEDDLRRVYYYALFPNTLLSLHPDYVMVHKLWPKGPAETLITCEWMFAPQAIATPGFGPDEAVDFWDMTNRQDWHVCELSQLGVASRAYTPGLYAGNESLLAAFDREVLRALNSSNNLK